MTGMVYQRVQKAAAWNPQHNNTEEKQKIKPKSASSSGLSAQERIDSLPDVPANWMELDPVYRRIQAKAAAMQLASSQKSDDSLAVNTDAIQMKCSQCEEKEKVQLHADEETQLSADDSREQVQLHANGQTPSKSIQQVAAQGFSGSATRLPHLNKIQQSFGINLSHVQAYIGGRAAAACNQMGAAAYASGSQIAFKEAPSVELAAHEAAHVVQQQSGKVQLAGGVGQVGDKYEQHADEVAARVEAGQSAGDLLAEYSNKSAQNSVQTQASEIVQEKCINCEKGETDTTVQRADSPTQEQILESSIHQLSQRQETSNNEAQRIQAKAPQPQNEENKQLDLNKTSSTNTDSLLAMNTGGRARRPASFSYVNISGPTNLGCGGFDWKVQWVVENQMPKEFGFVVQKVQFHLQQTPCNSSVNQPAQVKTYWEAWPVSKDTVYQDLSRTRIHGYDEFGARSAPGHYGINAVQGNAKYIPLYTEPVNWGRVEEAAELLATTNEPAGWSDEGTIVRHVVNDFNCCGDDKISVIQAGNGALSSEDREKIERGGSYKPKFSDEQPNFSINLPSFEEVAEAMKVLLIPLVLIGKILEALRSLNPAVQLESLGLTQNQIRGLLKLIGR